MGERALEDTLALGWRRHEALAAVLLAERLLQRGEPRRGTRLLGASRAQFAGARDTWGLALVALTEAKADLQRGAVPRAAAGGDGALRTFEELDDAAGQMMAMDLLGHCAEIIGDLAAAAHTHRRALAFARDVDAPEWQVTQLTRLGSVQALLGVRQCLTTLRAAGRVARSLGSTAGAALGWYERHGSPAGISYTAGRLALELAATACDDDAARLAQRSVALAGRTADPRDIAHGLEAVAVTHHDAPTRARALGGARMLRRRARSPLPPVIAASMHAVQQHLGEELGDELLSQLRAGAREAAALAAAHTGR